MRSPLGPVLVFMGVGTIVVLVLVLFQLMGLRDDLRAARAQVTALEDRVGGLERGVPLSELSMRLGELEGNIREWVVAFGGGQPETTDDSPAGGPDAGTSDELLERMDRVLEAIQALDDRVDQICEGVPVC